MNSIYSLTGKFLLLYRVSPSTWLLITAAFLLLWTFLMCLLDWHIPAEQRMNPMFQRSAHRRRRAAFVLNLLLMLVGLAIVALVTFVRRGSVEQRFVLYPFRVLYGMKAPGDYWQVTIMNLVLYVPFACGLTFCFGRSRGGFGRRSVLATVLICFLTVPISTFLALLISVALNSIKPMQKFLQTVFFLPYVTNSIAIGMVFAAMFNIVGSFYGTENELIVTAGIVNNVIEFFGGKPVNWINYGSTYVANIAVMVIYIVWNALPFKILILLGGLQSVNKQYYDAAKVDGTSRRRIFTRITVPLLSPMIAYVVITGFIGGFKEYTSIVGIFGESMGPADDAGRLNTMVGFIYDSLASNNQGRASAAALILFGLILIVTLLQLYVSKKRVHY